MSSILQDLFDQWDAVVSSLTVFPSDLISTGYLPLDVELGGGYLRGAVHEITGDESSGKTLLALSAARFCGKVLYCDIDRAVTERALSEVSGIERGDRQRCSLSVDTGLNFLERDDIHDVVVIDTLNTLYETHILQHLVCELRDYASRHSVVVLVVSQVRDDPASGLVDSPYPRSVKTQFCTRVALRARGANETMGVSAYRVLKNDAHPRHQPEWQPMLFLNHPTKMQESGADYVGGLLEVAERYGQDWVMQLPKEAIMRGYVEIARRVMGAVFL